MVRRATGHRRRRLLNGALSDGDLESFVAEALRQTLQGSDEFGAIPLEEAARLRDVVFTNETGPDPEERIGDLSPPLRDIAKDLLGVVRGNETAQRKSLSKGAFRVRLHRLKKKMKKGTGKGKGKA